MADELLEVLAFVEAQVEKALELRLTWAELLRRVFALDVLTCPHCGGPRRLIALLTDPIVVRRILAHLGHPTEPPRPASARSRELLDFA